MFVFVVLALSTALSDAPVIVLGGNRRSIVLPPLRTGLGTPEFVGKHAYGVSSFCIHVDFPHGLATASLMHPVGTLIAVTEELDLLRIEVVGTDYVGGLFVFLHSHHHGEDLTP